jgi:hypothetical protein
MALPSCWAGKTWILIVPLLAFSIALTQSGTAICDIGCCGGDQWLNRKVTGVSCARAAPLITAGARAAGSAMHSDLNNRKFRMFPSRRYLIATVPI